MAQSLDYEILPAQVKRLLDTGERVQLVDVREPEEHAICRIEEARLIPMNSIPGQVQTLEAAADNALIVVFCHHGMRSMSVVNWLRQQGVERCQSMAGGIERWAVEIDRSVPRY